MKPHAPNGGQPRQCRDETEQAMDIMEFGDLRAIGTAGCGHDTLAQSSAGPVLGNSELAADTDILPQPTVLDLGLDLGLEALTRAVVASFRANSHITNVMTHISGARWDQIEDALRVILDRGARPLQLSRLEANIVDLICAERGVTGRMLKPYFHAVLCRLLPPAAAASLQAHIMRLHETTVSGVNDAIASVADADATVTTGLGVLRDTGKSKTQGDAR
ncbi:hypothetical protein OEG84_19780 [Hoeflea sp. G2-23]|uniref:Uncharacterized protein n=1 Tax=Hoeflea algicola TaxID=2983763 RepID=A0ABT3ZDN0_9HYPH|nr:hypothetical protein [Hoeflea algicola]MCY0149878.1 hypothetical protein [Hoeflea algicola]